MRRWLAAGVLFASGAVPSAAERSPEAFLQAEVSTASLGSFLKEVSREPHVAGSTADQALAAAIARHFSEQGLQVENSRYDVLLSYPEQSELSLVKPATATLTQLEGERLPSLEGLTDADRMPWNAYSPSAEVKGQVVYANFGRPEDFEALAKLGIDVKGRIVLTRYGEGYRGGKSLEAEKRGAAAIVFYSDPAQDGYAQGDELPNGPWGPPDHFQRGANVYDFLVPGDPLTPGWASTKAARRIAPEDAAILPKIPSLPLSYRGARRLLEALEGPVVPKGWQGGLPLTYHVGPGPAEARLKVRNRPETRPIVNVLGYLRGSREPGKLVFLSSHHDAWTRGAVDDGIGTAIVLELARVFGRMARQGWRPKRTLVFASWDAEEYTLTGSTEWGEEHGDVMGTAAVAFLNVDAYRWGREFTAIAVPSLRGLIRGALADVPDPGTGAPLSAQAPKIGIMGSGSDYTVFLNHIGVPALETMFTGTAGAYHSIYDDYEWVRRVDPDLRYAAALARVNALMAWRLADAELLPLDYGAYARDVRAELDALAPPGRLPEEALKGTREALTAWEAAADRAAQAAGGKVPAEKAACADAALMRVERDLLAEDGLPGRPWFKHLIYAPRPTYEALTLPGLREALEAGDSPRALAQAAALEAAVKRAAADTAKAADCLAP